MYKNRLLFLEDDRDFNEVVVKILAAGGLNFVSALAVDREAYLDLLGSFDPDLIISDYTIRGIDGVEALRLAAARAPLVPFIALSGSVDDKTGLGLENLGAYKYLPKDCAADLPLAVADALGELSCRRPRILFFGDSLPDYELESVGLEAEGINYRSSLVTAAAELPGELQEFSPDIIVTDYFMPGLPGPEVLRLAAEKAPGIPVIVLSASVGEEKAAELFRLGATDYLVKDGVYKLRLVLHRVFAQLRERREKERRLRASEALYKKLFETAADGVLVADAETVALTQANPAAVAMFRVRDEEDFISYGPCEVSPERQPDGMLSSEKAKEMIGKAMKDGSNFFDWTHKRLDGEEFPVDVLLSRLESNGQVFLQGTVRELTGCKRAGAARA